MTEPNPAKDVVADVEADMRQRAAEAARLWPEWAGELCLTDARCAWRALTTAYAHAVDGGDQVDEVTAIALATTAYAVLSAQIARHGVGRALAVAGRLPPWVANNL